MSGIGGIKQIKTGGKIMAASAASALVISKRQTWENAGGSRGEIKENEDAQ